MNRVVGGHNFVRGMVYHTEVVVLWLSMHMKRVMDCCGVCAYLDIDNVWTIINEQTNRVEFIIGERFLPRY